MFLCLLEEEMNRFLRNTLNVNTLFDLLMMTAGSFFFVIALDALLIPNGLLSIGFTGIGIIVNHFFPVVSVAAIFYLMNIPAVIWAWKELNKRFVAYTLYAVTLQAVLMELMLNMPAYHGDPMLAAIFAGVFAGAGTGLVIRRNGSGGGVDIIGVIAKKKWGFSVGTIGLGFNAVVIGLAVFLFSLEAAMYTVVYVFVSSVVTDKIIAGFGKKYTAMIISKYPDEIRKMVLDKLHRGVTTLRGKGVLGDQRDVIYCAINQYELARLKDMIYMVDPDVFMTITETTEICGHFRNTKETALTASQLEDNVILTAQEPVTAVKDVSHPVIDVIDKDRDVVDTKIPETDNEEGNLR